MLAGGISFLQLKPIFVDHLRMPEQPIANVSPPPAAPDADDGGALIRTYAAELTALTDAQRAAFDRQCSAEKADEWGARTKARNVLADAERFARVMHAALAAPRGGLGYRKPRFRYFLEGILALREATEKDQGKGRTVGVAQATAEKARETALLSREMLIERLRAFAEGDEVRSGKITTALGGTKDDDATLRSLKALLGVATDWLASPDPLDQAMADAAGLDAEMVADAEAARAALSGARATSVGEGPKAAARDSAETNRIEGRVLFEMRYAMRLFEAAHGRDALSPRLIPSTGTRHVLARSRAQEAEEAGGGGATPPAGPKDQPPAGPDAGSNNPPKPE